MCRREDPGKCSAEDKTDWCRRRTVTEILFISLINNLFSANVNVKMPMFQYNTLNGSMRFYIKL